MKKNSNMKGYAATVLGSGLGAAVGAFAASALTSKAHAAKSTATIIDDDYDEQDDDSEQTAEIIEPETPVKPHASQSQPTSQPEPPAVPEEEEEVHVLEYSTVTDEEGTTVDVALVQQGEDLMILIDTDLDGTADLLISDIDESGDISDNEIIDISDEGVDMVGLQMAYYVETGNTETIYGDDPQVTQYTLIEGESETEVITADDEGYDVAVVGVDDVDDFREYGADTEELGQASQEPPTDDLMPDHNFDDSVDPFES